MPTPTLALLAALHVGLLVFALLTLVRRGRTTTSLVVWVTFIFILTDILFVAWVAIEAYLRWSDPACGSLCAANLPPYSDYWYRETFGRFGAYFGAQILTGLVFGAAFWWFARRTGGEVIDRDDVFLLTLSGMMVGWPNVLLFLAALFACSVAVYLLKRRWRSRVTNPRVVITPLIPLAAAAIVLWGDWLAARLGLYDLGFVAITLVKP